MKTLIAISCLLISQISYAKPRYPTPWVKKLCLSKHKGIVCLPYVGTKSITWLDFAEKDITLARGLKKINRRDTTIWKNQVVAVPWPLYQLKDELAFAPFPEKMHKYIPNKTIIVDLKNLAWGAYDEIGNLVRWSLGNGGSKRCTDTGLMTCKTPVGEFTVTRKGNYFTRSKLYPINCMNKNECGFRMYWYVGFGPLGEGLHGANSIPGRNVSHGCVRTLREDALWINMWSEVGKTKVVVLDY